MKLSELLSRIFISAGVILAIGAPILLWSRTPLIHVSMAENGGWNPDTIKAEVGQPLHLRMTSDDVVHGFAVSGDAGASILFVATPGLFGPAYFTEMRDVLAAAGDGPPDREALMAVMRRHGLTPAPPAG